MFRLQVSLNIFTFLLPRTQNNFVALDFFLPERFSLPEEHAYRCVFASCFLSCCRPASGRAGPRAADAAPCPVVLSVLANPCPAHVRGWHHRLHSHCYVLLAPGLRSPLSTHVPWDHMYMACWVAPRPAGSLPCDAFIHLLLKEFYYFFWCFFICSNLCGHQLRFFSHVQCLQTWVGW